MTNRTIIRAWKDQEYRQSLTEGELAFLPQHPAGRIELTDAALDEAAGGSVIVTVANSVVTPAVLNANPSLSNPLCHYGGALCPVVVIGPGPVR